MRHRFSLSTPEHWWAKMRFVSPPASLHVLGWFQPSDHRAQARKSSCPTGIAWTKMRITPPRERQVQKALQKIQLSSPKFAGTSATPNGTRGSQIGGPTRRSDYKAAAELSQKFRYPGRQYRGAIAWLQHNKQSEAVSGRRGRWPNDNTTSSLPFLSACLRGSASHVFSRLGDW